MWKISGRKTFVPWTASSFTKKPTTPASLKHGWQPYPVEYKRGKPGVTHGDALQLCGQALCLEEMLCCTIPAGAVYYGEPRRREQVVFTEELRAEVRAALTEMHQYAQRGYTPKVKPRKGCGACSLQDVCLPKLMGKSSVEDYVKEAVEG